jgi:hypothetical protein
MTGMAGRPQSLPNMPTAGYGGLRGPTTLGTGVTTNTNIVPHKTQADINKYGLVGGDVGDATLKQAETTENLYSLTGTAHKEGVSVSKDNTSEIKLNANENASNIVQAINSQPRGGGGTTIGIGGGSFGSSFGNFLMDMGTSFVVNKLTEKIKNPYVKAAANFAGQYAMRNYVTPTIASKIGLSLPGATGGGAAGGSIMGFGGGGMSLGGSMMDGLNNYMQMGPANMVGNTLSSFMPSMYSIGSTIGGSALGSTFSQFGSGFTYGATPFAETVGNALGNTTAYAAGQFAAKALPYVGSIMQALQGDFKAAAISAGATYLLLLNPVTAPFAFLGSLVGGLFGKKKRRPVPTLARSIFVLGNNDITKKVNVGSRDLNAEQIASIEPLLDSYLNIAFNATKTIEARTKIKPPFYAIVFEYGPDWLMMKLYREGETIAFLHNPAHMFNYGNAGSKEFKSGTVAKKIVKDIEGQFIKDKSTSEIENIKKATDEVTSQSFFALSGGLSSKLDLAKDAPVSDQEQRYADALKAMSDKPMVQQDRYVSDGESGYYEKGDKTFYNPITGKYETVADPDKTLYIDSRGNPVIDVGQKGFNVDDLLAHEQQYGAPITLNLNNVDQSQNDSSTNLSSTGGTGSSDPDSMAAASSGAYGPGIP